MADKYTTIQGDTWDMIAFKCYKNERYMTTLIEANSAYREVVIFSAGISLSLPVATIEPQANLPPWRIG